MRKFNKYISILLSVIMLISIIPITASAAETSGTCGDNLTWIYDEETSTLTISGTGAMYDYSNYYDYSLDRYRGNFPWKEFYAFIKLVVVENGVTTIGDNAFYGCYSLESITIPDSIVTINRSAFSRCSNLTSIVIPNSVIFIGDFAFQGCSNLTNVIIPDSVTSIGNNAFRYCDGLTNVIISDSVTTIGNGAFDDCDGLTNVIIPDSVTTIGEYAFYSCDNLTTVTIGDGTISIGVEAFYDCDNLTTIIIGDATETIGRCAFHECDNLSTVYLRDNITSFIPHSFNISERLKIYYSGTEEEWESIYTLPVFASSPEVYCNYHVHKWDYETVEPTCTTHGYEKQTCRYYTDSTCDYKAVTTYTANPTGHSFNEDGVCEVCGEKEVSTNHINNQMLTMESVFAMVLSFLSKLFGIFSV